MIYSPVRKLFLGAALASLSLPAAADIIGGVEFPDGGISFADAVVDYTQGPGGVTAANAEPDKSLGQPDYTSGGACSNVVDCTFVSLGVGGSLILQFVDNVLTGSDNSDLDLWIFEVGPDVEDTFVDISIDGINWLSIGSVGGSTSGIDLDYFGYDSSSAFSYVRLTDDPDKDSTSGASVGADIDAVGAISTRPAPVAVAEPGTLALLAVGALGLGMRRRRTIEQS